jgi:nitroreductase
MKADSPGTKELRMVRDLIRSNRSFRRFHQEVSIGIETLRELIELARLSPSGGNRQPLKFVLSCNPVTNDLVFNHLTWAIYLKPWPGPAEGERPSAYIIILGNKVVAGSFGYDAGIAAQSMLLGAVEKGLGGCIIGSVDRERLGAALELPEGLEILLVLALGKPAETVVIEPLGADGKIEYWRDGEGVHHVPKRPLDELILKQLI